MSNSGAEETYGLAWHSAHRWVFADADGDRDTDLADAATLMHCVGTDDAECDWSNWDASPPVDLGDYRLVQSTFTGPQ